MKKIYTFLFCLFILHIATAQDNKLIKASMDKVRLEF
ncbi:MAG: hypothetical protein JWP78_1879, partial [Mucilaginibacter sp.]|nr:hypothetical protein [Mucilaginibacter sp.]MDB5024124.1 hypothetical protein [Mucilaginibacter sp.]